MQNERKDLPLSLLNFLSMNGVNSRILLTLFLVVSGLLLLLAGSCSNSHTAEIKQIDSLIVIAENQFKLIEEVNVDSMKKIMELSGNGLAILQSAVPDSLIMTEYLNFTSIYGDINKAMKRGLPALETHKTALSETMQQLENLRHDIKKELINDTLLAGYFNAEKSILNQIKSESDLVLSNIKMKKEFFHEYQAKIDSFIQQNFQ